MHGDSGRRFVDVTGAWRVNRAVDGDVVAIEILPSGSGTRQSVEEERFNKVMMEQTQTSSTAAGASVPDELLEPSAQSMEGLALAETKDNTSNADNSSNTDNSSKGKGEEESSSSEEEKLSGRVVGIIRRNWRQYAGSLSAALADSTEVGGSSSATSAMDIGMGITGDEDVTSCLFQPVDGRIPSVSISTRRREALQGHRILVAIDSWPASSKQPLGHYVQTLGKDGDKAVETQVRCVALIDELCHGFMSWLSLFIYISISLYLCAYVSVMVIISNRGLLSYQVVHWRASSGLLLLHPTKYNITSIILIY